MPYVSLYRKYRPQTFDEVVGQEHVTTTLKNAIAAGRVGSGYLFTGTRGTAKTTCARVLAKSLNCIGEDGSRTSPTPTPCGVCGPCKSIAISSFVDVLEMDAASHGKVDDVRDLVASIKFPPMEGRYKVYIIDEAHQLSRDAMDAFLKTLEEPPDRVVFVLATTELEKLPITIASRCQVFEFKRGSIAAISSRLAAVLGFEGVEADPAAVTLIARAADGSYRDSLSLLEQVLAYKPTGVTPQDVSRVLGTVDDDMLTEIVARIAAHDTAGAFAAAEAITGAGKDVRQFLRTLSARLRDMLFVTVGAQAGASEVSAAARAQVGTVSPGTLLRALEILSEVERDMRWSNQHRLVLEITLLRLCTLGAGDAAFPAVQPAAHAPVVEATPTPTPQPRSQEVPPPIAAPVEQAPAAVVTRDVSVPSLIVTEVSAQVETPSPIVQFEDEPEIPDTEIVDVDDSELETATVPVAAAVDEGDSLLQVQQVQSAPAPFMDAPPPPPANAPADLIRLQRSWQEVVNTMGSRSPSGAAMIREAAPIGMDGTSITLKFANKFNVDRLASNERGRKAIEDIINKHLGVEPGTYRIKCVMNDPATPAAPALARQSTPPAAKPHEEPDELLETVIAVFGGSVVDE